MPTLDSIVRELVRAEVAQAMRAHTCVCTHPPEVTQGPTYLSSHDAAALIGVSPKTLANWRCARTGPPFVKRGALVRYSNAELRQWMSEAGRRAIGVGG